MTSETWFRVPQSGPEYLSVTQLSVAHSSQITELLWAVELVREEERRLIGIFPRDFDKLWSFLAPVEDR